MIDRQQRDHLALALRRLAIGRISNLEFENEFHLGCEDEGYWEVYAEAIFHFGADTKVLRYSGVNRLDRPARQIVARWILFLKSDLEIEWPQQKMGWHIPLALVHSAIFRDEVIFLFSLVSVWLATWSRRRRYEGSGDYEVWPFIRTADYTYALRQPPYLCRRW